MNDFLLIKFLHVIGLAYWLGGDLGVFYSSYAVGNTKLPTAVRTAAAKTLFALDQAPRICMTLMLPLGLHLAWRLGAFDWSATVMTLIWIVCLAWLANVVYLHFGSGTAGKSLLTTIDYWFRVLISATLIASGVASLASNLLSLPPFIAWKLIIFGTMIACGLMVRYKLRNFGPAFANLASGSPSDEDNRIINDSLGGTRPFVIAIWLGLFLSTALGLHLV